MQNDRATGLTITLFAAALAADMLLSLTSHPELRVLSKPLITIALLAYFLLSTREVYTLGNYWVASALVLSWMGDVLLLFEGYDAIYFLLGLSAFLLAHVAYLLFFNGLRRAYGARVRPGLIAPVAVYYAALIAFLYPHLGSMKLPVMVYGAVISVMLAMALHLRVLKPRVAGAMLVAGAVLFVVSDSLLAVQKFAWPFTGGGVLVMLSYGLAQFFIVRGSILAVRMQASGPLARREGELSNDRLTDYDATN